MGKQEFLHELQIALQGEVSQSSINENVRYYDNYILEETRKGRSEEEVIEQLGNPRLIAKTLINTTDQFGTYNGDGYYSENYGRAGTREQLYDEYQGRGRRTINIRIKLLIAILAAVLLIVIVANVVAFLLPFLVPIILIWLIYSLFFGNRR